MSNIIICVVSKWSQNFLSSKRWFLNKTFHEITNIYSFLLHNRMKSYLKKHYWEKKSFRMINEISLKITKYATSKKYLTQLLHLIFFWYLKRSPIFSPNFSLFVIVALDYPTVNNYILNRRPVPSIDQALPSCFYIRISWILI